MKDQIKKFFKFISTDPSSRACLILLISLCVSCLICFATIFLYLTLFWGQGFLDAFQTSLLLDSPSTIAFNLLMTALSYFISLFILTKNQEENVLLKLFIWPRLDLSFLISSLMGVLLVFSVSVLFDQFLFLLTTPLEKYFNIDIFSLSPNLALSSLIQKIDYQNLLSSLILIIMSLILIPVLEELFFRGYLWSTLRNRFSFILSAFISSTIYAFFYFGLVEGLNAFVLGFLFALIREKNPNNIWLCIIAHVALSCLTFVMGQMGFTYGVFGNSYPVWLWLSSLIGLFGGFWFFNAKK
jgi:membrane protease YdiL (CAAX protease family)